jgi:Bacteriocin-protection, YdeI or OmpD-Associated/Domain of unknown function (DUF1905)
MQFRATIRLDGKSATGIEVPADVLGALGGGKRPPVVVTIGSHTYRTTVGSMGGRSLIPVSADVRAKAGVAAGDEVIVVLEPDTEPRTITVPADLAAALAADPAAQHAFDALSYSGKSRHVTAIEGAKTPETRQRRVAQVLSALNS